MKLRLSASFFQDVSIKVLLGEIIVLIAIFSTVGYLLNPEDPFLVNERITYLMVLLTVLTLYYGLGAGLIALFVATVLIFFLYDPFPTEYFLWHALLTLIMGEFNFYWVRNIERATLKSSYLEDKLYELAKNFILLKESHNQLERAYLVKPISIRSILYEVRKAISGEELEKAYNILMNLLYTNFELTRGAIYRKDDDGYTLAASTGEGVSLDPKDPLVRMAIEEERICYISMLDLDRDVSRYLAVVPLVDDGDVRLLLLVEKMPFLSLNKDNLFLFYVLLHYIYKEEKVLGELSALVSQFGDVTVEFIKELKTHYELKKAIDVNSTIVVFYIKKSTLDVQEIMEDNLRTLDVMCRIERDDREIYIVLLPFSGMEDAKGFYKRFRRILINYMGMEAFTERVRHRFFRLTESPEVMLKDILSML